MEGPPWPPPATEGAPGCAAPSKSFADMLSGSGRLEVSNIPDLGCCSIHRGEPALRLSQRDMHLLSMPFKNALVGRFPFRRPPMEVIRGFFVSLGLKGDCEVGLLDMNHVLIRPLTEEDYTRLFVRRSWFVKGAQMLLSKWTLDFKVHQDSTYAPVWVSLPSLPLPLFNAMYIAKLAGLLGRCLKIDAATLALRRPSVARVLIEMDISKQPPNRIWIGEDQDGFWQAVEYESWPKFCGFCTRFGHEDVECFRKNPDLQPSKRIGTATVGSQPNNGHSLLQREGARKQVEWRQRTDGALVSGQGVEGKIAANCDPEMGAPSVVEDATADMGRGVQHQTWVQKAPMLLTNFVNVSTVEEVLAGDETAALSVAADVIAAIPETSSGDIKELEQASAHTLVMQVEEREREELVAASVNTFAVLNAIDDMEVQDFDRTPARSAGHFRAAKGHRRQCSDGDNPGEVAPWEQLKQFQMVLHRRLRHASKRSREGLSAREQPQDAGAGRIEIRLQGGHSENAPLNQVQLQSKNHYSLRSHVKSH